MTSLLAERAVSLLPATAGLAVGGEHGREPGRRRFGDARDVVLANRRGSTGVLHPGAAARADGPCCASASGSRRRAPNAEPGSAIDAAATGTGSTAAAASDAEGQECSAEARGRPAFQLHTPMYLEHDCEQQSELIEQGPFMP